ncbi:bifunctional molybdopterin-guanine dinucleotide biosynthesis adaptor protein MobB/molybdopterin molybdotransferase MoeA [Vibrio sp. SCSIO 43136]|uniref:bifunctional molybdopterin-guanine dinucleotide biosynthesis adaptor protein MobB/molybdopterin molybdotransferase MoeA n=1 Tax=Vibrio sp. SCSIO 43136 TaxID=2819101 RepID=UPI0020764AE8|nr:bifunctional molybdopterin-guanine dinucleotide biosynthesis adaptor protein MobB/molybdopterin molybdotransferase MoeA [Vibrio sp. SCSIO 43136]USD66581.1 bifunctional molybdopterin-guanine dinucleotide biosynthesis adaptor protein MobB/molybdopterin molybdotransferase MoeA [Vibrio sp. SCSIO 43136]
MTLPDLPILGFAAYSGTGKTTLLESLLPKLTEKGLRIGVLKHAHHNFDVDKPGKDSYRLRKAGAEQMLIASRNRFALMTETPDAEAQFEYLLSRFDAESLDIILVEGCKNIAFPKIELHRQALDKPWLYPADKNIVAIACDEQVDTSLPVMSINDLDAIAQFVVHYASTQGAPSAAPAACCDTLSPAYLSVEQGQQAILEQIEPLEQTESVVIDNAYHRTLAQAIKSPINVPAYTNSAMDGYAINGETLCPSYTVVAEVMAGQAYEGTVAVGEAVKIMTGAPMPAGCDTVIMREQSQQDGDMVTFGSAKIKQGQNVRQAGEDLCLGSDVFAAGTLLESPEMGMVASLGFDKISVFSKLKVAIFSTGDEVQAPGEALQENRIYDSNRFTLKGVLTALGCEVIDLGILEDDHQQMANAIKQATQQADMILTSGGVSVGDADYIKDVLDELGQINFWRINMRPGRPLAFGKIDHTPFFGLPGNPVAVMVSFINFVEPAIRKMQGQLDWLPLKVPAVALEPLRSRLGRTEFSRGVYALNSKGQLEVRSTGKQGSGILRSMSEANCLIEISPSIESVKTGEAVTVIPLQGRL